MSTNTGIHVLLSGDEGTGTLAAVRGLHAAGHRVWLAVSRGDTYAARSRSVAGVIQVGDPNNDLERHARDVSEAASRVDAAVVLPGTEGSLRALTGREHLFAPGAVVGTCSSEVLDRATDKLLLMELSRRAGLEPAPTFDLCAPDLEVEALPFPAIAKPQRSVVPEGSGLATIGVLPISDAQELGALMAGPRRDHCLLQPHLDGTLAAVCGLAWGGELVCAIHQHSPRTWPPRYGPSSYAMTVPVDAMREAGVAGLVRALGWSGIFGLQFLLVDGHAYVIDFNPRIYGSLALAIAAGMNLPALWVDLLMGRSVRSPNYRPGARYRVEEDDPRALLALLRSGRWREAVVGLLPRQRTVHAVFALSDPKPSVMSAQKLIRGGHEVAGSVEAADLSSGSGRFRAAEEACAAIDHAVQDRVLVFGSLPPKGRDLDLVVRPSEEGSCREALTDAGFAMHKRKLASFECSSAYEVELQPVAELGLSAAEQDALFADALPLPGFQKICEPSPQHSLLLLACVVLDDPRRLDGKRRQRVARALAQDPRAWESAAAHADGWPDPERLVRLRRAYEHGSAGPGRPRLARHGMVIALSGIDGSGKSSQAESLQRILEQLGCEAVVEWVPMASNRSLDWIGRPLKRVLSRLEAFSGRARELDEPHGRVPNEGSVLRERSAIATYVWTTIVALMNAVAHLRTAAPHLAAGRIVIFDRYVLDSIVRLRFFYGEERNFAFQRRLIRLLSPRPACAFFLDVTAAASLARKDDRWHADELSRQVELYRSEHAAYGAQRIDGELPRDQLCAEIAAAVWRRMS